MNMFASQKGEGTMSSGEYAVPGGKAHKFFAYQTLLLSKGRKWEYPTTTPVLSGLTIKATPDKNMLDEPKRTIDMVFIYKIGYSEILTQLQYLNNNKLLEGKGFSSIKIPQIKMDKGMKLEKFCSNICNDDTFLTDYTNFVYGIYSDKYQLITKSHRFDIDKIKASIKMDALKLVKYFESVGKI